MEEKIYIGMGKQGKYGIKLSIPMKDIETLVTVAGENSGWANLELKERREASEKGWTHYMVVDTWKPEPKEEAVAVTEDDDLPF
jgi:hypothetical protein